MTQNIRISTTIPEDKLEIIRHRKIPVPHLILLGLEAFDKNPKIIERLNKAEENLHYLEKRMRENHLKLMDKIIEIKGKENESS